MITTAPSEGVVIVNHDGSVTYMPNPGFPKADAYGYEVCKQGEDLEIAVVTVIVAPVNAGPQSKNDGTVADLESQSQLDSSNNFSKPHFAADSGNGEDSSRTRISQKIFSLTPKPFFNGYSKPSARITGRIYDASGSLVGEASANTNPEGNWSMQFNNAKGHEFYQVQFETVSAGADEINGRFGLNPGGNSYQTMSPLTNLDKALSVEGCLLYTSPSPRDRTRSRMPSSA